MIWRKRRLYRGLLLTRHNKSVFDIDANPPESTRQSMLEKVGGQNSSTMATVQSSFMAVFSQKAVEL